MRKNKCFDDKWEKTEAKVHAKLTKNSIHSEASSFSFHKNLNFKSSYLQEYSANLEDFLVWSQELGYFIMEPFIK